jgi:hypothetical protein
MAESLSHMEYVERMVKYVETIPLQFVASMMYVDLASYGQRTPKIINGYYPDLYYYDLHCVIIGEAKTTNDIDNEHTMAQLDSYIKEIRTYNCERHIIVCSSIIAYAQINNLVIRKKRRENIQDITFHVMDNHLRHRVI